MLTSETWNTKHERVPDWDESYVQSLSVRNSAKAVLRNLNVDL